MSVQSIVRAGEFAALIALLTFSYVSLRAAVSGAV